jgi:putative MATE family efflux protein
MRKSVSTSLILLAGLGLFMTVVGVFTARPLLKYLLAVPDSVLALSALYLRIYALGLIFQFVYNIVAAVLRAVGDSRATLYFLLVSSIVNVVLDLVFVAVFHWGVGGAAVATVISQACSALVSVVYMFKKHALLRFQKGELTFSKTYCITALKLGVPVALQQCVIALGSLFVQRLVNYYGTSMMSAYAAACRLENYVMVPIFGFNAGMNVYVGQNVGAGQLDRVRIGFRQTVVMSAIFCLALSAVMLLWGGQIVRIFGISGEALDLARQYVRCEAPFFIVFAVYQVAAATLQGSGDVTYATCCTLGSLAIRIMLSYFLAFCTPMSYTAIWWSMFIGWAAGLIPAYIRYFTGKWKTKAVV